MKKIGKPLYWAVFILAMGLLAFLCLYHLDVMPLQNWDEARHGVSAYEMMRQKEHIVTTYGYQPDYWNLKPPLSEYFIMLGYALVGYKVTGLRLYSAVAMILTGLLCGLFAEKKIGRYMGIVPVLALASMSSILFQHGARNGDADMLYVLFYTLCVLNLILSHERVQFLFLSCLFASLAFLTKSWHAGILVLIILLDTWLLRERPAKRDRKLSLKEKLISLACLAGPALV